MGHFIHIHFTLSFVFFYFISGHSSLLENELVLRSFIGLSWIIAYSHIIQYVHSLEANVEEPGGKKSKLVLNWI